MNANHKTTYFDRLAELRRKNDKVAAVPGKCGGYPARDVTSQRITFR
jgi:hypothetical protein